jgi:hypothetical protein
MLSSLFGHEPHQQNTVQEVSSELFRVDPETLVQHVATIDEDSDDLPAVLDNAVMIRADARFESKRGC